MNSPGIFDVELVTLDKIIIVKAGIDNRSLLDTVPEKKYHVDINYDFEPGVNIKEKKIRLLFTCEIKLQDICGTFNIAFIFSVSNFDSLVHSIEEEIRINLDLVTMLANLSYSTARGIIYTRCQGTILADIILPVQSNNKIVGKFDVYGREDASNPS